ncbi:DNA adenine methylase [Telmatospirillum sp. J64-1]|uniref:DNA adenine methylase n=1 Tax=Telmatospirillum sp. J64-1 TaxID=2502183 RepID=UPI00115D9E82|nr:DNA adenine methylase [Telmatospirillum sp. J64-1]
MATNDNHAPVRPVAPVAAWVGGKRRLASKILQFIETTPHDTYAEPFVGLGGVFLRRRQVPKAEVINDASRDVATFFRILQRHYPQFMETLRFQITSRARFEQLAKTDPETLTDLERAARFLYLQRLAYGGKVAGRTFGVDPARPARFNLNVLGPRLEELHERLAGVVIECLDFEAFLSRYDRPGTLFYCDPPYWGSEGYYGKDLFSRADFERLSACLQRLKGRIILSINDTPQVREIFGWAELTPVSTTYTVGGTGKVKPVGELIITNA